MEVYCVKEKRHTPNVKGTEKVFITKKQSKTLESKVRKLWKNEIKFFCRETE